MGAQHATQVSSEKRDDFSLAKTIFADTDADFKKFFEKGIGKKWLEYMGLCSQEGVECPPRFPVYLYITYHIKVPDVIAWVDHRGFRVHGNQEKTLVPEEFVSLYVRLRTNENITESVILTELKEIFQRIKEEAKKLSVQKKNK